MQRWIPLEQAAMIEPEAPPTVDHILCRGGVERAGDFFGDRCGQIGYRAREDARLVWVLGINSNSHRLDEAALRKPACGRTFGQLCRDFLWLNFDLAWPPGLREPWFQRPVEAQNNVPPFSGDSLDPVALFARWYLRAKVDVHGFISVHQ
jgi:hypothetical protein